jgi:D-glycero-alpha-D-manno-heptose-7-phosphate kinase
MSFFGGGTDYEGFFNEHGGSVISSTFDKFGYTTIRHLPPFFKVRNSIIYSKFEDTQSADEIEHPLVRNAMKYLDMHDIRLVYDSDLVARSGLGSSSSFAVGIILGFYALKGKYISKYELAKKAIHLERVLCAENGGWQDQVATAYGGLNRINFHNGDFSVHPIIISEERKKLLNDHLMLFFSGFSRTSSEIAASYRQSSRGKKAELLEMLKLVDEGEILLSGKGDICEFGRLLNYTWELKRKLSKKISTDYIDDIYKKALDAGAIGGKLLGAGGGGFLMIFAEPGKHTAVREALINLLYVPFTFENDGAQIVYFSPETYIERNDILLAKIRGAIDG